jgi:general secretion pathway protein K|tara:strand:+ start:740 stop:1648 length:909 start_codon:yes stop_codon:yes gene_type:complete
MAQYVQSHRYQSGVALLQVLLISAVISLLAIRFTQTARDQIEMAHDFDQRIRAQMAARSVFNELLMIQVSTNLTQLVGNSEIPPLAANRAKLNRYGEEVRWRNGILVGIQDLNGLLPRLYPRYFLWRILLEQQSVDSEDIDRYLGIWSDLQDTDTSSWISGEEEPATLNGLTRYPNRIAQTDSLLKFAFLDDPKISKKLLSHSTSYPSIDVNLFNVPASLLHDMFGPDLASNIQRVRSESDFSEDEMRSILPLEYRDERLSTMNSTALKITVSVPLSRGRWIESWSVRLTPGSVKPFFEIVD